MTTFPCTQLQVLKAIQKTLKISLPEVLVLQEGIWFSKAGKTLCKKSELSSTWSKQAGKICPHSRLIFLAANLIETRLCSLPPG